MSFYPQLIPTPFAAKGDKSTINLSQATSGDGSASWSLGFGPETSQLLPPRGQGKPVSRLDMNGVLNQISQVAYYAQSGGIFQYNKSLDYQANRALVYHDGQLYICVRDNSSTVPVTPGTNDNVWMPLLSYLKSSSSDVGNIVYRASDKVKSNQLICNGAAYSRTKYAALFEDIGTTYGEGDGSTTFNVPDLRGVVIRGVDAGRGLDPDRVLGSYQEDTVQAYTGSLGLYNNFAAMLGKPTGPFYVEDYGPQVGIKQAVQTDTWIELKYDNSRSVRTSKETRMKNIALLPVIFWM